MARRPKTQRREVSDTEIKGLALSIIDRAREIQEAHPEVSNRIDRLKNEIRERLEQIRGELNKLDKHDRELLTTWLVNSIGVSTEQVLAR